MKKVTTCSKLGKLGLIFKYVHIKKWKILHQNAQHTRWYPGHLNLLFSCRSPKHLFLRSWNLIQAVNTAVQQSILSNSLHVDCLIKELSLISTSWHVAVYDLSPYKWLSAVCFDSSSSVIFQQNQVHAL